MPHKNREERLAYQRKWLQDRREAFFKGKECISCGSKDQLELDHVDPSQKVSHRIFSWSKERMLVELAKCQILCRSCHIEKSRQEHPRGEHAPNATITEVEACAIRNSTESTKTLAARHNLNRRTIQRIRSGGLWSHLA